MGKKRKKGFTLEQHQAMGVRLKRICDELGDIQVTIGRHYVVRVGQPLPKAIERVQAVKCMLDSLVFEEHPEKASPKIYYGCL